MVVQRATDFMVGSTHPGRANMAVPPPVTVNRPGSELPRISTADPKLCSPLCYHSTGI